MKQTKKGFVEIPQTTLNALKNMLFSQNKTGVDLSSIIKDLTPTEEHHDITAINIALVYNGVPINIDERPRFAYEWKRQFARYDYLGYSLILGIVKVRKTICELSEDGTIHDLRTNDGMECLGFDIWNETTTNIEDIFAEIEKRAK